MKTEMHLATKLGLAGWFEEEAARIEREAYNWRDQHILTNPAKTVSRYRTAAYALRGLTVEQEVDMLEFQVGGEDGSGPDSYDNPSKIIRPPPPFQYARDIRSLNGLWDFLAR